LNHLFFQFSCSRVMTCSSVVVVVVVGLVLVTAQQTCFADNTCVNLRDDAPSSLRTHFDAVCRSAPLWRSINCGWFGNATARILNLTASDVYLPDLTAVLMYSRGGALWTDGANEQMRASQGKNLPVAWRDSLVLTGSGLRQLLLRQSTPPPAVVWRSEPAYAGAPCVWGTGLPAQEFLASSVVVSGFTSTTTSLPFAESWPFGAGASRILALFRRNATGRRRRLFGLARVAVSVRSHTAASHRHAFVGLRSPHTRHRPADCCDERHRRSRRRASAVASTASQCVQTVACSV
jgi:hypothetical protein